MLTVLVKLIMEPVSLTMLTVHVKLIMEPV